MRDIPPAEVDATERGPRERPSDSEDPWPPPMMVEATSYLLGRSGREGEAHSMRVGATRGKEVLRSMPTAQKAATIDKIKQKLSESGAVILSDYRGLTVKEMQALRTKLREAGGDVKVYKNTLTELALRELEMPAMGEMLQGPTLFTFTGDDPVAPAKAIMDFAKDHKQLEVKGAFIEQRVVGADQVKVLASLPPRDVLIGQLMGLLQSPIANLMRVMNGPAAAFARALQAVADQKQAA